MIIYKAESGRELRKENAMYIVQFRGENTAWFTETMVRHRPSRICQLVVPEFGSDYVGCLHSLFKHLEEIKHEAI